ncbi:DNA polymerase III subunit chi [Nitratireductor indicus]|uniref:DNA polymerase III subunit chi n=1 Tax=Nitratireductor indicus C115 TaxID=1231190 RepID=K2NYA1_9HYPH|nr:DNA polymerase III subunit chi [Nitratireductor indicus]EKF42894.1 DNA polymerase III subunit chi [Nitratireductor indicus C115]MDS1134741.1 DNA polymerase III subunit chi [Nitratireductor indicus]SFQ41908.1 DNA polymerase III, chi subunit [Nitratireductor indicus]
MDVLFYHLTESTLEEALPPLVEKSLERGWKVAIQTGSRERCDALDQLLWTWRDESFLAHGTDREEHADLQPVLLCDNASNGNGAQIRFLVDNAVPDALSGYERAVFLFDGHDVEQLDSARAHWKTMKGAGHAVTYWQQGPDRRWQKKAG